MRPTLFLAGLAFGAQPPVDYAAHPVVSPTGNHIAFNSSRAGTPDLYVMHADGSGVVRLTATTENEGVAGWSADGKRVMFTVVRAETLHVYSVGIDASDMKEIGRVNGRAARVTRDGSTIVYGAGPWTSMQLFVAPVAAPASAKQVTSGSAAYWCHALSADGRIAATRAAWSPDAKRLAVQRSTEKSSHIWIVDVASGAAHKLAEHSAPYLDKTPSWFPDGKRVAFQSDRTGRWEIWVADVDGGPARQLSR